MTRRRWIDVSVIGAAGALGACGGKGAWSGGPSGATPHAAPGVVADAKGSAGCSAPSAAAAMAKSASSSTVALARVAGKRVAYVADEDARAILTIDLDTQKQIAETPLDGTPAQVWVASDGRVLATLRDKSELVALAAAAPEAPLTRLCSVATPAEPIAIASTPDDALVLVASGWGQRLTAFDVRSLAVAFEAKLPREPRSLVVADDGKTAFVSHAVGSIVSAVDLGGPKHESHEIAMRGFDMGQLRAVKQQRESLRLMRERAATTASGSDGAAPMLSEMEKQLQQFERGRPTCQGFALAKSAAVSGRIFAPEVVVDPGDLDQRPDGYGDEQAPTEAPAVAVIDEAARAPLLSSITIARNALQFGRRADARDARPECLLPRAATVDEKTKSLLVTCFGIDAVVAYDATAANPLVAERRRWTVGSGPTGVAVDTEKHRAVVWSQFDRTLSTFAILDDEVVDEKTKPLTVQKTAATPLREKLPAEYALGRILFHAAGDARIAADGRACASCHPDGRDDAITWATPEGPRRSIMLAGRATASAPYSWNGNEASLHGHLGNTFERLSGKGVRSIELDALVTYISQMPAPPRAAAPDKAKADRGREIFTSREAGCATCHAGASFTDGRNHDVGSKHGADRGASFNTPSLRFVGRTAPYFHDGRYANLRDLLTKSDGKMGHTKHLSNADLEALETYLETL